MPRDDFPIGLQRIIGQIRYRPTLTSFQAVTEAAKLLEDEFTEWLAPKPDVVTLYTPENKKYIEITSDAITYVKEGVQTPNELQSFVTKVFDIATEKFKVVEIRRIGFRKTQILETTFSFSDLVDLLYKKLYPQNAQIKEISGENTRDLQFVLDSSNDGFLNHTQIGPLDKKEVSIYFRSKFDEKVEIHPNQGLFIDVDVFANDDLTVENTKEKLDQIISENDRILKGYLEYIQS
ncbi:MAG: hypothetical protein AAB512_02440 [Patescibacteria group bacterium]